MTDYPNAVLLSDDWIPRLKDGGGDALIESVAPSAYQGSMLIQKLNEFNDTGIIVNIEMLAQYLADRYLAGEMIGVIITGGPEATGTERYDAPTGIGQDENGIWFSTPDTGTEYVRWYVNGQRKIERQQDLASNRSATLAELGAGSGDVVQVCVVAGGVVGWWGRVVVE